MLITTGSKLQCFLFYKNSNWNSYVVIPVLTSLLILNRFLSAHIFAFVFAWDSCLTNQACLIISNKAPILCWPTLELWDKCCFHYSLIFLPFHLSVLFACCRNYVVQFILDLKISSVTTCIRLQFEGNYAHLSRQKFGSHVVEKCLAVFNDENRSRVILELLSMPHFEHLLQDPHANYVVQSALRHSEVCYMTTLFCFSLLINQWQYNNQFKILLWYYLFSQQLLSSTSMLWYYTSYFISVKSAYNFCTHILAVYGLHKWKFWSWSSGHCCFFFFSF